MAAIAFVLICTAPGKEKDVYGNLGKIKEITEAYPLFGEYDIIARVEAEDFGRIGEVIVDKVRHVEGVLDTKTLSGIPSR